MSSQQRSIKKLTNQKKASWIQKDGVEPNLPFGGTGIPDHE